jgi:hypothetical protein
MILLAHTLRSSSATTPHGGMTGDATEPTSNGYRLTVTCACGVVFERWVTAEDADEDLFRLASLN